VLSRWLAKRAERRKKVKQERADLRQAQADLNAAEEELAFAEKVVKRHQKPSPRVRAVQAAKSKLGETEHPPGSNRGPFIDKCMAEFTTVRGVSWCGAFVGWCLRQAGVEGLTERILYVPFIIDDAKHCRNGFAGPVNPRDIRLGDLVCMDFGGSGDVGEHVGIARGPAFKTGGAWYVPTYEGNTSTTVVGSQSNGGIVASRTRPLSCVVIGARPKWPAS
jgi:hypothetical protein